MTYQLSRVCQSFDKDISSIKRVLRKSVSTASIDQPSVEWAILKLHDCWAFRCRQLIRASALGGCITRSGGTLPKASNLKCRESFLSFIRKNWTHKKVMDSNWEPKWYDPSQAARVCSILDVANENEICFGLGASVCCNEIRIVRNVIAHSLGNTWYKYRELEKPNPVDPYEFALAIQPNLKSRFTDWITDLQNSLYAAAE